METKWAVTVAVSYLVLLLGGTLMGVGLTFFTCQKIGIVESLKEAAIFAVVPALVPALMKFVPRVREPFENVLRDVLGVAPEKAPMLAMGYVMMLLAWIMGARAVGNVQKAVCIPTPDEVAEFKAHFQKKAAAGDAKDAKRDKEATKKA